MSVAQSLHGQWLQLEVCSLTYLQFSNVPLPLDIHLTSRYITSHDEFTSPSPTLVLQETNVVVEGLGMRLP